MLFQIVYFAKSDLGKGLADFSWTPLADPMAPRPPHEPHCADLSCFGVDPFNANKRTTRPMSS